MELAPRRVAVAMRTPAAFMRRFSARCCVPVFTARTAAHKPLVPAARLRQQFHTSPPASSQPRFTYGLAASYSGKDDRFKPASDVTSLVPSPAPSVARRAKFKRPKSGQDSYFMSQLGSSSDVAFGVADGVGGWADSGVDPADFSHALCEHMAFAAAHHDPSTTQKPLTPQRLMQDGFDAVAADRTVPAGGSTACVALAKTDGRIDVANLGDSGFVHLRLNAVHHASEAQTHHFNAPYQLALIPPYILAREALFGARRYNDSPRDSIVERRNVRHGDVLVFATDGVFDNLSSSNLLHIVSRAMIDVNAWEHSEQGVQVAPDLDQFIRTDRPVESAVDSLQSYLAMNVVSAAKAASLNRRRDGPFAKEMLRHHPWERWRGGKVDDICVIVAVVVEEGK